MMNTYKMIRINAAGSLKLIWKSQNLNITVLNNKYNKYIIYLQYKKKMPLQKNPLIKKLKILIYQLNL